MPTRRLAREYTDEAPAHPLTERVRRLLDPTVTPAVALPTFAVLYVLAFWAGRRVLVHDNQVAAIGAAIGIAFMWLSPWVMKRTAWREPLFWASALFIGASTALIAANTGRPSSVALLTIFTNPVAAVVTALAYRGLRHSRHRELISAGDMLALTAAVIAGVVVGWLVFPLPSVLTGNMTLAASGLWFLRNVSWLAYFAVLDLLFLGDRRRYLAGAASWAVVLAAVLVTGIAGVVIFRSSVGAVSAFLLLTCVVLATTRLSVLQCVVYLVALAGGLTLSTVVGGGPYERMDPVTRTGIVHLVQLVALWVTLSLSLDREERALLMHELEQDTQIMAEQAGLLSAIVGSMDEGVIVLDADGQVRMRNEAAAALLAGAEPSGPLAEEVAADGAEELRRTPPQRPLADVVLKDESGSPVRVVAVESHALPASGRGDTVAIMRDVTDERRQVSELRTFARVAAHDLRQPLSAIELWVDTLRDELAQCEMADSESLDQISAATARMETFLRDLVHYTVAREGKLELTVVSLQELLDSVVADHLAALAEPRPAIRVDTPFDVRVDRPLVRQVFDNLVGNAIKYTPEGAVAELDITAVDNENGYVRVVFADRGIGVPVGQERLIFEEFHRVPGHAQRYPGTGLGLAICRRIIDRHHGNIAARAREGGGTVFDVTLPA